MCIISGGFVLADLIFCTVAALLGLSHFVQSSGFQTRVDAGTSDGLPAYLTRVLYPLTLTM